MSFKNLNLINPIVRAATEAGCAKPSELQNDIIPQILNGRDILCCMSNDMERLTSFIMPIIQLLKKNNTDHNETRVLILTSTKESALRIEENFKVYTKYLPLAQLSVYDGISNGTQLSSLRKRLDLIIATPDKLLELDEQRHITLSKIEMLVVDEADELLESNSGTFIKLIHKLPIKRQNIFYSSTISKDLTIFAERTLNNRLEINKKDYFSAVS
ncbi:DEAD/DEAH box helicase [Chryseobacterium sp.]|uniref:DEAD/DEAH box helicase n=1 Tax=Chryseobacterium sp. TaxID=1871047 RepID=UPI00388DE6FF